MNIEVVSLIYKSEGFLDFIIDQLKRYCVSNIHNISFRVVANDPINNIEAVIAKKGIRYSIFKNDNPNEYYINRVYRAYNFCVKSSESDYVCLVNSDMGFSNGWIENLSKLLD